MSKLTNRVRHSRVAAGVALTLLLLPIAALLFANRSGAADDAMTWTATPVPAYIGEGIVDVSSLNFRSGPHLSYTAVGYLVSGERITLVGRNRTATWVQMILYNGYRGWVNASYIRSSVPVESLPIVDVSTAGATAFVVNEQLYVYAGPGPTFQFVDVVPPDTVVPILGRSADATWINVALPFGRNGWAAADGPFVPSVAIRDLPVVSPFLDAPAPDLPAHYYIYAGPSFLYQTLSPVAVGQALDIAGRTADSSWVKVIMPDGSDGWVPAAVIRAAIPLRDLPVTAEGGVRIAGGPPGSDAQDPGKTGSNRPTRASLSTPTAVPSPTPEPPTDTPEPSPTALPPTVTAVPATPTATMTATAATTQASATPEATQTQPPAPAATETPTETPTPASADETATATATRAAASDIYIYEEPSTDSPALVRLVPGQSVILVGRTADSMWIKIYLPDGTEGWLLAALLQTEVPIDVLPVVDP